MDKELSKHIAAFDYFDKALIVLSATSGSISVASFATVIGTSIGITSTSFSFETPALVTGQTDSLVTDF